MKEKKVQCVCIYILKLFFSPSPQCNVRAGVCVAEGMRLRGRDLEDSTGSWIPSVPGVHSVRLRLRFDRRTDKGRSLWQLVNLSGEASGRGLWDRTPPTCSQSKNGVITSLNCFFFFYYYWVFFLQLMYIFFLHFFRFYSFYALDLMLLKKKSDLKSLN